MNKIRVELEENNASLIRDESKCIKCGMCLSTCNDVNNIDGCITCGACILTCPTGALQIKDDTAYVMDAINDPTKTVIVSTSPATRVAIGDAFGYNPGELLESKLVGALRLLGFNYVYDTTFGADLTTMEEACELIERIKEDKDKPMFTSCCPSWIRFMEEINKKDLNHISTCKSPISMQSKMIKEYLPKVMDIKKEDIVTVFLTPCVSKKSEIKRPELDGADYVLTNSELTKLLKDKEINLREVEDSTYDKIFSRGSGAGVIFGTSGGVMESALRTAYFMLNNEDAPEEFYKLMPVRGIEGFKEAEVDLGVAKIKVAVINKISNVERHYNELKQYDFVEVMTCPGGCLGGAGQPKGDPNMLDEYRLSRMKSLYAADSLSNVRASYENHDIKDIYDNFLDAPGSPKAHEYLHTAHHIKE